MSEQLTVRKIGAFPHGMILVFVVAIIVGCTTTKYFMISEEFNSDKSEFRYSFYSIEPELAFTRTPLSDMDSISSDVLPVTQR